MTIEEREVIMQKVRNCENSLRSLKVTLNDHYETLDSEKSKLEIGSLQKEISGVIFKLR